MARTDTSQPTRADGHADPRLVGLQAEWVERVARPDLLRCLFWIPHHPGLDVENTGELLARIVGGPTRVAARRERLPGCAHFVRHRLGRRCRAIQRGAEWRTEGAEHQRDLGGVGRPDRGSIETEFVEISGAAARGVRLRDVQGRQSGTRNRSTPFRIPRCGRPAGAPRDRPARQRVSAATRSAPSPLVRQ